MKPGLLHFSNLNTAPIIHFITERHEGFSSYPYNSLNLGFQVGDDRNRVDANRKLLAQHVGISASSFCFANQVHGAEVVLVDESTQDAEKCKAGLPVADCDAMITQTKGLCLMILTADCVPVLLYDPVNHAAGIVHAGWRGTLNHVVSRTIDRMCKEFGTRAVDVIAGIGPSIGPCCYEIGEEVVSGVKAAFGTLEGFVEPVGQGKNRFNLWYANTIELLNSGVSASHIESYKLCTRCNHHRFFSSRAANGITGRIGAGILLLKK